MTPIIKRLFCRALIVMRPILEKTVLRNPVKIESYQASEKGVLSSSMVSEFNLFHDLVYRRFFQRVKIVRTDITSVQELCQQGPVVFVMKNRGQLEYRFFNSLFLKEKIEPICYANNVFTVPWRPVKKIWQFALARLADFYQDPSFVDVSEQEMLARLIANNKNVLINLSISRDYLFGLFNSNPLSRVKPILELQRGSSLPINIVPLQFLYDKQPEKMEKSFFDFLFGEKSRPGALRKILLFAMSFRKTPQAKFGAPINMQNFLEENVALSETELTQTLYKKIEETLSIEHARITGPKLKSKDTMIHDILREKSFLNQLQAISGESGESVESLKSKAKRYLEEIAADVNYSYVHFSWLALNYLWNNIFDGLVVKHDQLSRIREVAGKSPVVLVPMHRSHIDYLLISHIFYSNNITFPHVCAGINLNFWPVGKLIRKGGGFFIRRRFDGNVMYKESLYSYIKALVNQGYCIEFFIEGTRSRTGKLLKPKLGILSQLMRAYLEGERDDVYFVPIAINYDQIIEQKSYQSEGSGSEKNKEHAGELLKARKILNKKYGKVYIEFADPISLKDFLEKKGIQKGQNIDELRNEISDFGYHLTYHINKVAVVTPISMVSLAILSLEKRTFGFEELMGRIRVLKDYLDYKNVTFSDMIHYSDRWAYSEAVQILQSRHLIKEVKTFEENFYTLEPQHRLQLDYYKNNILHFFVSLTCFSKIVAQMENGSTLTMEQVSRKYDLLKKLFQNDFTFSSRVSVEEHLRKVMAYCEQKGLIRSDDDFASFTKSVTPENESLLGTYLSLLDNFLESHLIALKYLKFNRLDNIELKIVVRDIMEKSKALYLKDDLKHPEALNRFNLENSLKFCADLGLLKTHQPEKGRMTYSSVLDADLIDRWIQSTQDFLKIATPERTLNSTPKLERTSETRTEEGLH